MWSHRLYPYLVGLSAAFLLPGCNGTPGEDGQAGRGGAPPGGQEKLSGLVESPLTAYPTELESRLVLRGALVNPADADNYVGYVLTFFGKPGANGCQTDTTRSPEPSVRRYLKAGAKPITTDPLSQIWFQSIVTDSARLAAQYLGFNLAGSHNSIAEVVVEDVAKAEVDDGDVDYVRLAQLASRELDHAKGECKRLFVMRTYLTSAKSRVFRRTGGEGEIGYVAVKLNGAYYTSSDNWIRNLVVAVDARGLDDLKVAAAADTVQRVDSLPRLRGPAILVAPPGGFKLPELRGVRINPRVNTEILRIP